MVRRRGVLAAALLVPLGGCASAGEANPRKIGPRGVDELVIPTPSPDPDDFVVVVDNPWFPLAPGTVWTYDVSGSAAARLEVTVQEEPSTVAGVRCTPLHRLSTTAGGAPVEESWGLFAQDGRGNVWLFGEYGGDRSWAADALDAEAGLVVPAAPRVGDGYLQERAPGVAEDRVTVVSVDAESSVPAGTFGGLLLLETRSGVGTPRTVREWYAEGTGLVESYVSLGGTEHAELVSVTQPSTRS